MIAGRGFRVFIVEERAGGGRIKAKEVGLRGILSTPRKEKNFSNR